jgi:guanine deaminase
VFGSLSKHNLVKESHRVSLIDTMSKPAVYLGTFIHSKSLDEIQILHDAAVFVDEQGKIVAIEKDIKDVDAALNYCSKLDWEVDEVIARACGKDQFFFPGFIGTILSHFPILSIFGKLYRQSH